MFFLLHILSIGGDTGEIETIGEGFESGGGNEVAMSLSFRPSGDNSKSSGGSSGRTSSSSNDNGNNEPNKGIVILYVILDIHKIQP